MGCPEASINVGITHRVPTVIVPGAVQLRAHEAQEALAATKEPKPRNLAHVGQGHAQDAKP
jgi:hypothetical protein